MNQPSSSVRNISDTASWVAYFRARETQRPDALFRDPYAERLASEQGFRIANTLAGREQTRVGLGGADVAFRSVYRSGDSRRRGFSGESRGRTRCAALPNRVAKFHSVGRSGPARDRFL
jgi:hypothetical protein